MRRSSRAWDSPSTSDTQTDRQTGEYDLSALPPLSLSLCVCVWWLPGLFVCVRSNPYYIVRQGKISELTTMDDAKRYTHTCLHTQADECCTCVCVWLSVWTCCVRWLASGRMMRSAATPTTHSTKLVSDFIPPRHARHPPTHTHIRLSVCADERFLGISESIETINSRLKELQQDEKELKDYNVKHRTKLALEYTLNGTHTHLFALSLPASLSVSIHPPTRVCVWLCGCVVRPHTEKEWSHANAKVSLLSSKLRVGYLCHTAVWRDGMYAVWPLACLCVCRCLSVQELGQEREEKEREVRSLHTPTHTHTPHTNVPLCCVTCVMCCPTTTHSISRPARASPTSSGSWMPPRRSRRRWPRSSNSCRTNSSRSVAAWVVSHPTNTPTHTHTHVCVLCVLGSA